MSEFGVRVQEKGQVTIPRQIRKKLNLKRGDLVVFVETDEGVIVKPASVIADDALRAEVTAVVRSVREKFKEYLRMKSIRWWRMPSAKREGSERDTGCPRCQCAG